MAKSNAGEKQTQTTNNQALTIERKQFNKHQK